MPAPHDGLLGSDLDFGVDRRRTDSRLAVLVALAADVLVAVAKSAAVVVTHSNTVVRTSGASSTLANLAATASGARAWDCGS